MVICVDLDGVLIGLKAISLASDGVLGESDATDYKMTCFSEELRQAIFSHFHNPKTMCEDVKVLEGVIETLSEWVYQGHKVYIVTARSEVIRKETRVMVANSFPMVTGLKFVNIDEDKNRVLRELRCDLFIDDAPHNIEASSTEFFTVMISNKYTRYNHFLREKVTHFKCIRDIDKTTMKVAQIGHRNKEIV